jgi:hypothetical protein
VAVNAPAAAGSDLAGGERPCGLLVDWGGVLTTNVFGSFDAFCAREGLEAGVVRHAFVTDDRAREALIGLELGTLAEPEFEARMARVLGVDATNLIERLMGGAGPDLEMLGVVRRARDHGIATGLISATVGIRKPAPEIYELGARSLHLQPTECVFVDDLRGNLKPARALGMTTVHHVDAATTIGQLSDIFGIDLR